MIGHLRNVLGAYGITCVTKNLDLSSAAGELPPIDCWPELWVEDEQLVRAKSILKKTMAPLKSVKKPWTCGGCAEEIFEWNLFADTSQSPVHRLGEPTGNLCLWT